VRKLNKERNREVSGLCTCRRIKQIFKIPTVLSKYAVTEDRWDQQQLIAAILKKYDTSTLKIGKRYSVNTISNKSGQQAVLKTTFWKEDTCEIYFNTEMQKPIY
jgi:hypothetical protein